MKTPSEFAGRYVVCCGKSMGPTPGAETRDQPDEPDVLDAGDGIQAYSRAHQHRVFIRSLSSLNAGGRTEVIMATPRYRKL